MRVSADIGHLRGLQRLVLKDCKLEAFPATLSFCTALEHLDASNNPGLTALAPEMHKLSALQWLDLTDSATTSTTLQNLFPEKKEGEQSDHKLTLRTIRFSGNKFAGGLPEALGSLLAHCLDSLELSSCELATLPDSLCALGKLTRLDISKNKLTSLPSDIGRLQSLLELNIDSNPPLKDIPASFGSLTQLQHLAVANIRISRDGFGVKKAEIIDEKVQKFSRLIRMCLSSGGHPDLIFAMRYLASKRAFCMSICEFLCPYFLILQQSI